MEAGMHGTGQFVQMLVSALPGVPIVIALFVGMLLVALSPRSNARLLGLCGLAVLVVGALGSIVMSLLPAWLMSRGDIHQMSIVMSVVGLTSLAIRLVGLILVIWALVKALRNQKTT